MGALTEQVVFEGVGWEGEGGGVHGITSLLILLQPLLLILTRILKQRVRSLDVKLPTLLHQTSVFIAPRHLKLLDFIDLVHDVEHFCSLES